MTTAPKPTPSKSSAAAFTDVVKQFGTTTAVDHVTFALEPHELAILVGPSGCGKSTLLRMAAGLVVADSGTVQLNGLTVDDGRRSTPPERRNVGLVFQDHALFPHLTVHENVGFGLDKRQRKKGSKQIDQMLDLVGLLAFQDRYPHELSGGEQQRVAIARALATEPELLLLDEPFASLDTNLRSQVRRDVISIIRSTGIPTILVTHEQHEALSFGDRLVMMHDGQIVQSGAATDVFHQPATRFAAEFMGEADFLPVTVANGVASCELGQAPYDSSFASPLMMVRPDDLVIEQDRNGTAHVLNNEFRGASRSITIQLDSGPQLRADVSHVDHFDAGERVAVSIKDGHRPVVVDDEIKDEDANP